MARTVATTTDLTGNDLREFVASRHRMILMTSRADGSPQASPVVGGMDDAGRVVITSYPERAKARNLIRNPTASVLVLSDDFDGPWVQVDGTAEVIAADDDVEPFVEYFRCISGEHPDWDEYRAAMVDQGKVLLRITPTRWSPAATGGFPARLAT